MKQITPTTLSALVLLASGIVMAFLGFYTAPEGEISDSVLWYISQCLIYAGSVFGVGEYVKSLIDERKKS